MPMPMPIPRRLSFSLAVLAAAFLAPAALAQQDAEAPAISATAPSRGAVPTAEFMAHIYDAAERGGRLYDDGRYAEALPYLAAAAERGFKVAQASLGDIVLNGRGGVPRDTQAGIGWLGVAAESQTLPRIERYFEQVIAQLPADYKATANGLVDAYQAAYGNREHRVACRLFGEVVQDLRCRFIDDEQQTDIENSDDYAGNEYVEEMVVTAPIIRAPEPEFGQIPSGQFISEVYGAANRGSQLYREGRYKEALPLLVIAAKRGFKWAQAFTADIYLHGRGGVPVDLESGIGWLGVAAQPKTTNSIISYFKESRALLPERFTPEAVDQIVADYRTEYGNLQHRVACRYQPDGDGWSIRVRNLRCHFIDEATQCRDVSLAEDEIGWQWTCQPIEGSRTVEGRQY